MAFKINVAYKGKTFKVETEDEKLVGSSIGDKIKGEEISEDLTGYEIEITGTSDKAGFMGSPEIDGPDLHKVLLGYGRGMHKKPKGEKKTNKRPKGLRLRKTVRGEVISEELSQINLKVITQGKKTLKDIFAPEKPEEKPVETPNKKE